MPHESNMYHAGVDVLQRMAKDKAATFVITINKAGKWVARSGYAKTSGNNFVNVVSDFAQLLYPTVTI